MNPQMAQYGHRLNELAGPGGMHDHGGQDAGWWIVSILAVLLLIAITGLLVWIGRTAAALRTSLAAPVSATGPAPPAPGVASDAPTLVAPPTTSEAPTAVTPNPPAG